MLEYPQRQEGRIVPVTINGREARLNDLGVITYQDRGEEGNRNYNVWVAFGPEANLPEGFTFPEIGTFPTLTQPNSDFTNIGDEFYLRRTVSRRTIVEGFVKVSDTQWQRLGSRVEGRRGLPNTSEVSQSLSDSRLVFSRPSGEPGLPGLGLTQPERANQVLTYAGDELAWADLNVASSNQSIDTLVSLTTGSDIEAMSLGLQNELGQVLSPSSEEALVPIYTGRTENLNVKTLAAGTWFDPQNTKILDGIMYTTYTVPSDGAYLLAINVETGAIVQDERIFNPNSLPTGLSAHYNETGDLFFNIVDFDLGRDKGVSNYFVLAAAGRTASLNSFYLNMFINETTKVAEYRHFHYSIYPDDLRSSRNRWLTQGTNLGPAPEYGANSSLLLDVPGRDQNNIVDPTTLDVRTGNALCLPVRESWSAGTDVSAQFFVPRTWAMSALRGVFRSVRTDLPNGTTENFLGGPSFNISPTTQVKRESELRQELTAQGLSPTGAFRGNMYRVTNRAFMDHSARNYEGDDSFGVGYTDNAENGYWVGNVSDITTVGAQYRQEDANLLYFRPDPSTPRTHAKVQTLDIHTGSEEENFMLWYRDGESVKGVYVTGFTQQDVETLTFNREIVGVVHDVTSDVTINHGTGVQDFDINRSSPSAGVSMMVTPSGVHGVFLTNIQTGATDTRTAKITRIGDALPYDIVGVAYDKGLNKNTITYYNNNVISIQTFNSLDRKPECRVVTTVGANSGQDIEVSSRRGLIRLDSELDSINSSIFFDASGVLREVHTKETLVGGRHAGRIVTKTDVLLNYRGE